MRKFPIGILSDSLRLGLREGIKKAAEMGVDGVQVYAVAGETAPENMTKAVRRDLLNFTRDLGLQFSAICGDLGGHGFTIAEDNEARVERSMRIMDLALDLGCRVVTTHIGVVPADEKSPRRAAMASACARLARYGDSVGACFAVETGPEPSATLRGFLDGLGARGVGVNLDPANLAMVVGEDAAHAVKNLAPYIVHTHAKDGVMLKKTDPRAIYDFFAEGGIGDLRIGDYFREVPLGQGQIDWPEYLKALEDIGYEGFLTIEREVGEDPEKDIAEAVEFLRGQMR
jgi:sugar phosphate isomerase/epimerase